MSFDEHTYEMIAAYLNQRLSDPDRLAFEERIQNDADLAREVTINKEMYAQYGTDTSNEQQFPIDREKLHALQNHLRSEEIQELSQKIKAGKKKYDRENTTAKKPILRYLYYAAAAIALVFLVNHFFMNTTVSPEELYAEYNNWEHLPSLTVRGDQEQDLAKGEALFIDKKYIQAIPLFTSYLSSHHERINPHVLTYLGIAYLESNTTDKALPIFDRLLKSDTIESDRAYWYIALTYLKQGNDKKAIANLKQLRNNPENYYFEKAGELLSQLEK